MRDPCTKQHPVNDLQELETGLGQLHPANQKADDALAELLRIIGGQDRPQQPVFAVELQPSAETRQDAKEPGSKQPDAQDGVLNGDFADIEAGLPAAKRPEAEGLPEAERSKAECKSPTPRAPLLGGDFAAIEAGLLGGLREEANASASKASASTFLASADLESERLFHQNKEPAARHTGIAERQITSRRPLYAIVAIVVTATMAVSFVLKSQASAPSEIATSAADSGPAVLEPQAIRGADLRDEDTATLTARPEPSPAAAANDSEQRIDLAQPGEKAPLAVASIGANASSDSEPEAVAAPAQPQPPADLLSAAAPAEAEKVKDDLTQRDTTPLTASRGTQSDVTAAPASPQPNPAAVRAQSAKPPARLAKTAKPAAATVAIKARADSKPRKIVSSTMSKGTAPIDTASAPVAKAETPAAEQSPASLGAFEFIHTALNSLTTTTAKLLGMGRD
jgi:hypothetical protein